MDEETAAAVNGAVQSAIGAISGGVGTAQSGVDSLQAHADQVSGLSEQAGPGSGGRRCDQCTEQCSRFCVSASGWTESDFSRA